MELSNRPLIVGAGPVGLAAALFLVLDGRVPRVVEMLEEPSRESRALAINPRTLEILEPTGVTRRILDTGSPILGVRFYSGERKVGTIAFTGAHPRYPFMLALSQAATERLLTRALEAAGGGIERGMKLVQCENLPDGIGAGIEPTTGGGREIVRCPWMLAADGAHSTVRQELGIDFPGSSLGRKWSLADAPLETKLAKDHGHVFFLEGGAFLFMIRVVDPELEAAGSHPVWRVISNRPDPLSRLALAEQAGPTVWTSEFHISHRMASTLSAGGAYLAGDAAHIHSPLGARGMNLGIEDARVFADLARRGRLADYDRLRRPVDRRVVRQVGLISRVVASESWIYGSLRAVLFRVILNSRFFRSRVLAAGTGLDHQLPRVVPGGETDKSTRCEHGGVGCFGPTPGG